MKKCAVVFKRLTDGKEFWLCAKPDRENPEFFISLKNGDSVPLDIGVCGFYGQGRVAAANAAAQDACEQFSQSFYFSLFDFEEEPVTAMEIINVLYYNYGDDPFGYVKKGFPLKSIKQYELDSGQKRPFVYDIDDEDLLKYYHWRKNHHKGKVRDCV